MGAKPSTVMSFRVAFPVSSRSPSSSEASPISRSSIFLSWSGYCSFDTPNWISWRHWTGRTCTRQFGFLPALGTFLLSRMFKSVQDAKVSFNVRRRTFISHQSLSCPRGLP